MSLKHTYRNFLPGEQDRSCSKIDLAGPKKCTGKNWLKNNIARKTSKIDLAPRSILLSSLKPRTIKESQYFHSSIMSDLPDEITEEILVRLPAISLVRFNLVCKQWRSLISNPNFVRKHLNHVLLLEDLDQKSNNNHHHKKFIIYSNSEFYSIDCCHEEESQSLHSISVAKRHFPLQSPHGVAILGSCNGLLFIGFYGKNFNYDTLLLWNPLLGDYNILPQRSSISWGYVRLLGFGYDSSIDDYKVVALVINSTHALPMRDVEQKVEIYTLKTNSWKMIRGGIPYGNVSIGQLQGTLVSGSIYWLVTDYEDEEGYDNLILAFDLIDEKFRLFGIPSDDDGDSTLGGSLVEVRGCLGLYQTQYSSGDVMIWILKDDVNNNEYWTKLMRIPKDIYMHSRPVFFMKNDEVLLSTSDEFLGEDKKLVVYDPRNATFRNLPACGISDWWDEIIYIETLVSLNDIGRSLLEEYWNSFKKMQIRS